MMGLTRRAEYAIRGMLYLSRQDEGGMAMLGAIADAVDAPRPFLAKILQSLAYKGLIRSTRGAGGGFALARPAPQISLCDIVEAIEGPIMPNKCLAGPDACSFQEACPVHPVWRRLQTVTRGILEEVTLQTLAGDTRKKGSNGTNPAKTKRRQAWMS